MANERQRGLGRGLSALLGEQIGETESVDSLVRSGAVQQLPIEDIDPNPTQPRRIFNAEILAELASSIREKGILQPILVRPHPRENGRYEIIAGERRWRAAQQARLTDVPVVVSEMDDMEMFEVAVIENVQRADLNPLEEADAFKALMDRFGRTQDQVAGVVGKSRSHVANTLRLLQLPEDVLWYVREGHLTAGHARALVNVPQAEALAKQAHEQGLNVRQVEALARQAMAGPGPRPSTGRTERSAEPREGEADLAALEQDLGDVLGLKVSITDRNGRGQMTLNYATLEQLDDLCRRLMR
jgi:ParB-like partition proteins